MSVGQDWKIALYFTWRPACGREYRRRKKQRRTELPSPILGDVRFLIAQCPAAVFGRSEEILLANCLAHGRRQFVEVAEKLSPTNVAMLPGDALGLAVWSRCSLARERGLTLDERLRLHQDRSGPVMDQLGGWLEAQLAERPDGAELRSGGRRSCICCATGCP